jgi:hypothetical protein
MARIISIKSIILSLLLIFYLYLIFSSVFSRTFEGADNMVPSVSPDAGAGTGTGATAAAGAVGDSTSNPNKQNTTDMSPNIPPVQQVSPVSPILEDEMMNKLTTET